MTRPRTRSPRARDPRVLAPRPLVFRDQIVVRMQIQLTWMDRIRLFFRGALTVIVRTDTENALGRTQDGGCEVLVPHVLPRRAPKLPPPEMTTDAGSWIGDDAEVTRPSGLHS